jgi:hypothetical protein
MADEAQATTEATESENTPVSEPAPVSEVTDVHSYLSMVKADLAKAKAAEPDSSKPRDDKGRFLGSKAPEGEPLEAAEGEGEGEEKTEPEPGEKPADEPAASPDRKSRLAELEKRIAAEKERRRGEIEARKRAEETAKFAPIIQGLQQNKVQTVLDMLSEDEFGALCDLKIARMSGKEQEYQASSLQKTVEEKIAQLEKRQREHLNALGKANFATSIERMVATHPDIDVVHEWLAEKGSSFGRASVEYADTWLAETGDLPSMEQTRDGVIAFVLKELETAERVSSKRKPKAPAESQTPQKASEPEKPRKKTLTPNLKATISRSPEITVTGVDSYAELVKQSLRQAKR